MSETLTSLLNRHGSDKADGKNHTYGHVYDRLLAPWKDDSFTLLELGVLGGASLGAWCDFFERAWVVGIDINCEEGDKGRISTYKADCTDEARMKELFETAGIRPRIVVDDASHRESDQIRSFEIIKPYLAPGAIVAIEDVQCEPTHAKLRNLGFEIYDLRHEIPGRHDNVIAVYRAPG